MRIPSTQLHATATGCYGYLGRNANAMPDASPFAPQLWTHLLWENEYMSDAAVDAVSSAIRLEDGNALVPVFRAVMAMFDVDDTRRHWRVVSAMPYIIKAMETQSK